MPVSEPIPEKDKALTEAPLGTAANGKENEHRPDATSLAVMSEQEPIDEFGLPVKRPNRRTAENGMGVGDNKKVEVPKQSSESGRREVLPNGHDIHDHEVGINQAQTQDSQLGSPRSHEPHQWSSTESNRLGAEHCVVGETTHNVTEKTSQSAPVIAAGGVSEWSHQALAPQRIEPEHRKEEEWQDMPAIAPYDLYNDDGKLVAREARDSDDETNAYSGLGGAGRGYTRVQNDEDAQSATSMDDNTEYLFKKKGTDIIDEDDDDQRDPLAQMQATKDMLTEGQRIAYVGVTRLAMAEMVKELEDMQSTKATKKELLIAVEAMKMWSQKMMVRLYAHMEINSSGNTRYSS